MIIRNIETGDKKRWLEMVSNTFGNGNPSEEYKDYFRRHLENDSQSELKGILIAEEDGKILSTLRVYKRKMYLFGSIQTAGCLGEVCTTEENRKKGLSSILLKEAIQYMERNNLAVSVLRTGIHSFYGRLGWIPVPSYRRVAVLPETEKMPESEQFFIRPVDWGQDVPLMEAIHSDYSFKANGTFVRKNMDYWNKWVKSEAGEFPFMIIANTGMPVGYLFADWKDGQCIKIKEFCCINGYETIFDAAVLKIIKALACKVKEIDIDALIKTEFNIIKENQDDSNMIRLNRPGQIGNEMLETTNTLVDAFGKQIQKGYFFHETDAY